MTFFVLVHSPAVGPATWQPVAQRLRARGHQAIVPSLLSVSDGEPPYWPRVVAAVRASLAEVDASQPVTLVAHSNAGVFVPVLADGLDQPVECCIFADATVPAASGSTPVAEEEFAAVLRGLAGPDGILPRWSDWWGDADLSSLFPDQRTRDMVTAEQPRLPLRYFEQSVPAPAGWDDRRCGFVLFSAGYEHEADQARERGWPVRTVSGEHLHQVVDPGGVGRALAELARPG
jgi:hypothetical protein